MSTEFIIVRHGEPTSGGVEDPSLSELGRLQAEATAQQLAAEIVEAVYTSPLQRATQSAAPVGDVLGLDPIVDDRVAEFDSGQVYYSEKHTADMGPEVAMAKLAAMQSPEFQDRVLAGFDAIEAANPDATVAVVCHGGVISTIVGAAVYNPALIFLPEYGSITRVRSHADGLRNLVSYNESSWLPAAPG